MKELSQLPQHLLDWFGSDDVIGTIALANDSLQITDVERTALPRALRDIEIGALHPQSLFQRLRSSLPSVPEERLRAAVDEIMERIVRPVFKDLALAHDYGSEHFEPAPSKNKNDDPSVITGEHLFDPLAALDKKGTMPAISRERTSEVLLSEEEPASPMETKPLKQSATEVRAEEERAKDAPESEPLSIAEDTMIQAPREAAAFADETYAEHVETTPHHRPHVFQNLASILSDTNKNPLETPAAISPEEIIKPSSVPAQLIENVSPESPLSTNETELFDPLAPQPRPMPISEEQLVEAPQEHAGEAPRLILEEGLVETEPHMGDMPVPAVEDRPIHPEEPFANVPSIPSQEEKTIEDVLMGSTIDLSETNPEVETPVIITVLENKESDVQIQSPSFPASEESVLEPKTAEGNTEMSPENPSVHAEEGLESLRPSFSSEEPSAQQLPRPFILHEEKEEERGSEPDLRSYASIKPSFYRPSFSEGAPAPASPVTARLEFGDEGPSETPVAELQKKVPVSIRPTVRTVHYSSLRSETPFGNPLSVNAGTPQYPPVHPQNVVNLKEKTAPPLPQDVHPSNVINLKDLPQ